MSAGREASDPPGGPPLPGRGPDHPRPAPPGSPAGRAATLRTRSASRVCLAFTQDMVGATYSLLLEKEFAEDLPLVDALRRHSGPLTITLRRYWSA
jgi:hypothetical protein